MKQKERDEEIGFNIALLTFILAVIALFASVSLQGDDLYLLRITLLYLSWLAVYLATLTIGVESWGSWFWTILFAYGMVLGHPISDLLGLKPPLSGLIAYFSPALFFPFLLLILQRFRSSDVAAQEGAWRGLEPQLKDWAKRYIEGGKALPLDEFHSWLEAELGSKIPREELLNIIKEEEERMQREARILHLRRELSASFPFLERRGLPEDYASCLVEHYGKEAPRLVGELAALLGKEGKGVEVEVLKRIVEERLRSLRHAKMKSQLVFASLLPAEELAKLPHNLKSMKLKELEDLLAKKLLPSMGYSVKEILRRPDRISMVLQRGGEVSILRVKPPPKKAGALLVRSVLEWMSVIKAEKAIIVAPSGFTEEAKKEASQAWVELWDDEALVKRAREYLQPQRTRLSGPPLKAKSWGLGTRDGEVGRLIMRGEDITCPSCGFRYQPYPAEVTQVCPKCGRRVYPEEEEGMEWYLDEEEEL